MDTRTTSNKQIDNMVINHLEAHEEDSTKIVDTFHKHSNLFYNKLKLNRNQKTHSFLPDKGDRALDFSHKK